MYIASQGLSAGRTAQAAIQAVPGVYFRTMGYQMVDDESWMCKSGGQETVRETLTWTTCPFSNVRDAAGDVLHEIDQGAM